MVFYHGLFAAPPLQVQEESPRLRGLAESGVEWAPSSVPNFRGEAGGGAPDFSIPTDDTSFLHLVPPEERFQPERPEPF